MGAWICREESEYRSIRRLVVDEDARGPPPRG